jgi:hypothetical protein
MVAITATPGYFRDTAQSAIYFQTHNSGTSIYLATTNGFSVGAKTKLSIDYAGQINIGSTGLCTGSNGQVLPSAMLSVETSNIGAAWATHKAALFRGGGGVDIIGTTGVALQVNTNALTVNKTQVGVGATGPQAALDVGNNIAIFNSGNNQCLAKKFIAGCTGLKNGIVVKNSTTVDGAVDFVTPTSYDPIGVVVSDGEIANGAPIWIGICGQVQVLMAGITGIRGSVFTTRDGVTNDGVTGMAKVFNPGPDPSDNQHWAEIGHCNKNYANAGGTGVCILHFN